MNSKILNSEKGTWVFLSFVAFFGVIVAVNSIFITTALNTHSGVVTDQPYEKGLAYNEMLKTAREQPKIKQEATFENGVLRWTLHDKNGKRIEADVTARLVRTVKGGKDFEVTLQHVSQGLYETNLNLPMKGRWDALLKAEWQNQQYQTHLSFMAE